MIPRDADRRPADAPLPALCPRDGGGLGGGRARRVRPVRRLSPSAVALVVLGTAAALTMAVVLIPQVRFGYGAAGGHIAVETAAVVIALLVALLGLGRFRRGGELGDLLLTATFMLLALVNLVFTTIPAVVSDLPNDATTWGAVGGRMVGAGLLAAGAVAPSRGPGRRPPRCPRKRVRLERRPRVGLVADLRVADYGASVGASTCGFIRRACGCADSMGPALR
jgi:hypothetical protein